MPIAALAARPASAEPTSIGAWIGEPRALMADIKLGPLRHRDDRQRGQSGPPAIIVAAPPASSSSTARSQLAVDEITVAGNLIDMYRALVPADDLEHRRSVNVPTLRIDGMTVAGA